jgi:hypothetical protein
LADKRRQRSICVCRAWQNWFYYPGSATAEGRVFDEAIREASAALGKPSYHPDDWECE